MAKQLKLKFDENVGDIDLTTQINDDNGEIDFSQFIEGDSKPYSSDINQTNKSKYDPMIGFTSDLTSSDVNQMRAKNQGFLDEMGNTALKTSINAPLGIIGTAANILDVRNLAATLSLGDHDYSNFITDITDGIREDLDEALPTYKKNPDQLIDFTDSAFWADAIGSTLESAGSFGVAGMGIAKGLDKLTKIAKAAKNYKTALALQKTNQLTNSVALTYAEGVMTAADTYKQIIEQGGTPQEAAKGSANAMRTNMFNVLVNYTSVSPLYRTVGNTRKLGNESLKTLIGETSEQYAKRTGKELDNLINPLNTFKKMGVEAPQEAFEEGWNVYSQNQGLREGGVLDEEQADLLHSFLSEEGLHSMLLGAFGGLANTSALQGIENVNRDKDGNNSNDIIKQQYNNQRKLIQSQIDKEFGTGNESIGKAVSEIVKAQNHLLLLSGNEDAAANTPETLKQQVKNNKSSVIDNTAYINFVNGTTDIMLDHLTKLSSMSTEELVANKFVETEFDVADYKREVAEHIHRVKENEKIYNDYTFKYESEGRDYVADLYNSKTQVNELENNLRDLSQTATETSGQLFKDIENAEFQETNDTQYIEDVLSPTYFKAKYSKNKAHLDLIPSFRKLKEVHELTVVNKKLLEEKTRHFNEISSQEYRDKVKNARETKFEKTKFEAKATEIENEVKAQAAATATVNTAEPNEGDVSSEYDNQEYNDFIDKGIVSNDRLNNIANKIKNNEKLDEFETQIFNDKTKEINQILASSTKQPVETLTPDIASMEGEGTDIGDIFADVKPKSTDEAFDLNTFQQELDDFKNGNDEVRKQLGKSSVLATRLSKKLNLKDFKIEDVLNAYNSKQWKQFVKDNFDSLKELVSNIQYAANNPNYKESKRTYLNEDYTISYNRINPEIPPVQESVDESQSNIQEAVGEGKKLTNASSIAYLDLVYTTNPSGKIVDAYDAQGNLIPNVENGRAFDIFNIPETSREVFNGELTFEVIGVNDTQNNFFDVEAKKADIEKRRQKELKNAGITIEDRGDNYYSLVETKNSVISFEEREFLIGKTVNFIVKNPSNNKLINNYKGIIIKHESAGITGDLRIDLVIDNGQTFSIDRNGNFYTQSDVRFTEEIPNIVTEINAKYDAELAALNKNVDSLDIQISLNGEQVGFVPKLESLQNRVALDYKPTIEVVKSFRQSFIDGYKDGKYPTISGKVSKQGKGSINIRETEQPVSKLILEDSVYRTSNGMQDAKSSKIVIGVVKNGAVSSFRKDPFTDDEFDFSITATNAEGERIFPESAKVILIPTIDGKYRPVLLNSKPLGSIKDTPLYNTLKSNLEIILTQNEGKDLALALKQVGENIYFINNTRPDVKRDDSTADLGKSGFSLELNDEGNRFIYFDGKETSIEEMLDNVYSTINANYLNDTAYYDKIIDSGLYTTKVQNIEREYKGKKYPTYFSQVTIEYSNSQAFDSNVTPITEIDNSVRLEDSDIEDGEAYDLNVVEPENEVNYTLKSINILNTDKAKQVFEKGKKANWDLNKILTELQIPKEQKQLIIDSGKTDLNDIVTSLLANYSYTVEINTTKLNAPRFAERDEDGYYTDGDFIEGKEGENTKYYSNLTVPGGTNYTENEIATPLITPNIKGHAQFATDNGIGWFRSDDKSIGGIVKEMLVDELPDGSPVLTKISEGGVATKTRRILEVQSDIFQKSRDIKSAEDIYNEMKKSGELIVDCG